MACAAASMRSSVMRRVLVGAAGDGAVTSSLLPLRDAAGSQFIVTRPRDERPVRGRFSLYYSLVDRSFFGSPVLFGAGITNYNGRLIPLPP